MSYKLKDNARMLFLVTVVTALACMTAGLVLATQQAQMAIFNSNPFAISYSQYEDSDQEIPYVRGPVLIASSAFLAAQGIYFLIVRGRYIKSVNSMMV